MIWFLYDARNSLDKDGPQSFGYREVTERVIIVGVSRVSPAVHQTPEPTALFSDRAVDM